MLFDRRKLLALAAAAPAAAQAQTPPDPTEEVFLWDGPPPGALGAPPKDIVTDRVATSGFQDRYATNIGAPRLTVFRPKTPNGAAALVIPGGGYIRVVIDKEGFETARRFNAAGVTAFVLRYRLPQEGWAEPTEVSLQDAQQAVRIIRTRAAEWRIDPKRVLAIGFSAGGHVAARVATQSTPDVRPDLSALIYPVISMAPGVTHAGSREALLGPSRSTAREMRFTVSRSITNLTPPTFVVHAWDDASVPVANSLGYLDALREAHVPAEAHLFEEGGHGFGIRLAQGRPAAAWPDLLLAWGMRRGW